MNAAEESMTPQEFKLIEQRELAVIQLATWRIRQAREEAGRCPPPSNRRPATARDITEGALIWHEQRDGGWYWNFVEKVLSPSDPFKAYCADDGCRYGTESAFVEVHP